MKKRLFFVIPILILIIIFSLTKVDAANTKIHSHKYYVSVQINYGDTLTSIAEDYMTEEYSSKKEYIREVKKINNLGDDTIIAGNYLIIPIYSND